MSDRRTRGGTLAAAAIGAALLLSAATCSLEPGLTTPGPPPAGLGELTVAPEADAGSYERDAFGARWKDVDRNGCGQRDDVLARDLAGATFRSRCVVVGGTLTDPYTGQKVTFTKAKAEQVQIDHRVALAEAWRSGASRWPAAQRERFANDLANLAATAGAVNQGKGDKDAAEWLPRGKARICDFAARVIAVKAGYRLTADRAEADALSRARAGCPGASAPAGSPAP